MDDWAAKRLAELKAAAPKKRGKKVEPFVKMPLWFAAAAAAATKTPKAMVWIELVHAAWRAKRSTFPLPNARLRKLGVDRFTKARALRDLERAKLIAVQSRRGRPPLVTIVAP
jgi:hypothetical protein